MQPCCFPLQTNRLCLLVETPSRIFSVRKVRRARQESNPQPLGPKPSALSIEPRAHFFGSGKQDLVKEISLLPQKPDEIFPS